MRFIATALVCAGVLLSVSGCETTTQQKVAVSAVKPPRVAATRGVNAPLQRETPQGTAGEPTDPVVVANVRKALCMSGAGGLDAAAHKRLGIYLNSIKQHRSEKFFAREIILLNRLIKKNQTANCSLFS